jgi:hypothetical protein
MLEALLPAGKACSSSAHNTCKLLRPYLLLGCQCCGVLLLGCQHLGRLLLVLMGC